MSAGSKKQAIPLMKAVENIGLVHLSLLHSAYETTLRDYPELLQGISQGMALLTTARLHLEKARALAVSKGFNID